jgi:heme-degrading monooxygenase HmoA
MIAVWVTFRYESDFNAEKLRKIAEGARPKFEKMPGLRSKTFTLRPEKREAVNFYVWDSKDAAKAFFSEQLLESVTALYGVRPTIEYAEVAAQVSNA